jgi:hypothetical protein
MILRECETCERRTDQDRRQRAETEDSAVTIRTEYACTECGSVEICEKTFSIQDSSCQT